MVGVIPNRFFMHRVTPMNPWFFILATDTTSSASRQQLLRVVAVEHEAAPGDLVLGERGQRRLVVLDAELLQQLQVVEFAAAPALGVVPARVAGHQVGGGALPQQPEHGAGDGVVDQFAAAPLEALHLGVHHVELEGDPARLLQLFPGPRQRGGRPGESLVDLFVGGAVVAAHRADAEILCHSACLPFLRGTNFAPRTG